MFKAYNIVGLAAKLGGLLKIVMGAFGLIAVAINLRVIKAKLMRSLYFVEKPKDKRRVFNIALGDSSK